MDLLHTAQTPEPEVVFLNSGGVRTNHPMAPAIQLISTDFDGTLHADFETPPVPLDLQLLIADLQKRGAKWVINTGRDLTGVMEGVGRARLQIRPDYLVVVEREIHQLDGSHYVESGAWNGECRLAHEELFALVRPAVPKLSRWIEDRFEATLYEDAYSPLCLIAKTNADADAIHAHLDDFCREVPNLSVVRNDVYARFSHSGFNKGTAMQEIARQLRVERERVFAVGDHLNDLPMLDTRYAACLAAPDNAIPVVKETVLAQSGYVSHQPWGHGVARALEHYLQR